VSVVVPVYNGELTLGPLVEEILALGAKSTTAAGNRYAVAEIVLVYDNGRDRSDAVMRGLESAHESVRTVWLSRNFGQHAATLAGMSATTSEWVVTLDEDGQHNPKDIGTLLDAALASGAQVVYAESDIPAPHGRVRNAASKYAKVVISKAFGRSNTVEFSSFRLILGSIARAVGDAAAPGVYLDVALGWVTGRYASAPTSLRGEGRQSGYNARGLLSHFWRLVLTSGTRGLRLVSILGILFAVAGVVITIWLIIIKLTTGINAQGWTSTVVILLVVSGTILLSLGIIAEYIGTIVNRAMGKPAFLVLADPMDEPHQTHDQHAPQSATTRAELLP
jgi:glycosyltransferase involved in cell wall biosynthesis